MKKAFQHKLPKRRTKSLMEWLDSISIFKLILIGLGLYIIITLIFSFLEFRLQNEDNYISLKNKNAEFKDFLYFNFVTILTIGYGDYSPAGIFRFFSIIEAIIGLGIFSLLISFLTLKTLLPRKSTIVFSKFGYYSLKEQRFMIIYLNTANNYLINSETCSYVKSGGDWKVKQAVKAPFITKSVQTFFLDEVKLDLLKQNVTEYDCLRIGITGNIGIANYSTSIEYSFKNIIVINDRHTLTNYTGFWDVDNNINKVELQNFFHFNPPESRNLYDYLKG